MKRFMLVIAVIGVAAAAFAAWGAAAPWSGEARETASMADKLPPLPADVKARKRWKIGVKCDFPPFGYIGADGKKGGYDVDVAKRFAQIAFGKSTRVSMECVTTPSRIPALMSERVDIIISTLTYTTQRDEQIDFSLPYYDATGRLHRPQRHQHREPGRALRQDGRDDPRLDLRPLGAQLLQELEPARARLDDVFDARAQGPSCGHVHVRRRAAARDRRQRLAAEADARRSS